MQLYEFELNFTNIPCENVNLGIHCYVQTPIRTYYADYETPNLKSGLLDSSVWENIDAFEKSKSWLAGPNVYSLVSTYLASETQWACTTRNILAEVPCRRSGKSPRVLWVVCIPTFPSPNGSRPRIPRRYCPNVRTAVLRTRNQGPPGLDLYMVHDAGVTARYLYSNTSNIGATVVENTTCSLGYNFSKFFFSNTFG